jgi:Cof subfamily protein (haloacid dehalogenase superfamily)
VVSGNGTAIYQTDGTLLQEHLLPSEKVKAIYNLVIKYNVMGMFFTHEGLYASKEDQELEYYKMSRESYLPDEKAAIFMLDTPAQTEKMLQRGVRKISLSVYDEALLDDIRTQIEALGGVETAKAWSDNLGISPIGVNKGTGLRFLAEYFGIPPENILAMGDQENDIPMLKLAGIGVAVGNACQALKDKANKVVGHCNDHAVAEAIYKFVLDEA